MLGEVTVLANKRENIKTVQMGVQRLVSEEMRTIPAAFGENDVLKIVQTLPGVKTMGEASSGLNVRGGATDQNLILFDEATIYNPTHLFGFFSAFNSGVVDGMELYKSSILARYGGRISSVLEVSGRRGNKEKYTGILNLGLLTSSICLEGPVKKGKSSLLLSGRTAYSDWMLKLLPEKSGYKNGSAGFYDANVVYTHQLGIHDNLMLNSIWRVRKCVSRSFRSMPPVACRTSAVCVMWSCWTRTGQRYKPKSVLPAESAMLSWMFPSPLRRVYTNWWPTHAGCATREAGCSPENP